MKADLWFLTRIYLDALLVVIQLRVQCRASIDLNVPLLTNARLASAFIYAFCTTKLEDIGIKAWGEY